MNKIKLNINQLSQDQRPRERLINNGPSALTDAELLAILIGSGNVDETAVQLMQRVLADCNNSLKKLGTLTYKELLTPQDPTTNTRRYKGLGPAKIVSILAACELGRRRSKEETTQHPAIHSATDLFNHYKHLGELPHEEFHALLMNQACHILSDITVSKGGITQTTVDIRIILREALISRATIIAFCHNHPSGQTIPSIDDDKLTDKFNKACRLMNIKLLDHIIVGAQNFYSYHEAGKL